MTASPLLSIVVPNYNNSVYLEDCLRSVLSQTFRDFEVLVADDGSVDRSPEVIRAWERRYPATIRPLLSPVNRGVPGNLHWAIEQSRGVYLTTLDADDYYATPDKLEREMAAALAGCAQGQSVIAFSDILLVRADRTPVCLNSSYAPLREGAILPGILARSCLVPRDFVMPRQAYFDVGGYDPRVLLYDDWDLKIRLAEKLPFRFSGGVGTAYRQHGQGIASRPWADHLLWLDRVFEKNIQRADPGRQEAIRAEFAGFVERASRLRKAENPSQ